MYGTDYDYANNRLAGSIVRLAANDHPVKIDLVCYDGTTECTDLFLNKRISNKLDDLNLKPVPLGWCNTDFGGTYLSRIPLRNDWRQGLRDRSTYSSDRNLNEIPAKDLCNCIMGKYPSFEEAIQIATANMNRLVAWARSWATDGVDLFYKDMLIVGSMVENVPTLNKNFIYLKEDLEEFYESQ